LRRNAPSPPAPSPPYPAQSDVRTTCPPSDLARALDALVENALHSAAGALEVLDRGPGDHGGHGSDD